MLASFRRGSPGTPPTAPSRIASCALIEARSSAVSVSPVSRNLVAPSEKRVFSNRMALPAVTASSTFSASAMTSGPMPSPGMTASFTTRDMVLLRLVAGPSQGSGRDDPGDDDQGRPDEGGDGHPG